MTELHATGAGAPDSYSLTADLYDFVVPYRNRQDVSFFVEAGKEAGGQVLELGCGTGRVAVPMARAGVDVVGLDRSPRMLAICRERLAEESAAVRSRVRLVEGDMRAFDLNETFRLITAPFRPFQHLLTVGEQCACLECVRRHLARNGRFILDLFNPSLDDLVGRKQGEEFGEEPPFSTPDGRRVVRRHRTVVHDRFGQVSRHELIYYVTHPDGREERLVHSFPMRYLFRFEAEHLLVRCGFAIEQLYAGYDKSPYGSQYPGELIFVARRAARGASRPA